MAFLQKIMGAGLCAALLVGVFPLQEAQAFSGVQVVAGGVTLPESNPQSVVVGGRTYVPLRLVSEALGQSVQWDQDTSTVFIGDVVPSAKKDTIQVYVEGQNLAMNQDTGLPWMQTPGYTMVPLRVIAEALQAKVDWHDGTVYISTAKALPPAPKEEPLYEAPSSLTLDAWQPAETKGGFDAESATILGESTATLGQMQAYIAQKEAQVRLQKEREGKTFVPFPKDIAKLYYEIGERYGVRGDLALCQALLETGNFQYGNEVKPWQNNFCGLGATGRPITEKDVAAGKSALGSFGRAWLEEGLYGWCFSTPSDGVEAHIQHLYSYASANPLPSSVEKIDGRFAHGYRGKVLYWTDLNGKWAVPGNGYGERIVDMGKDFLKFI